MQAVDEAVPPDADEIHLVLDSYGTHKTPRVVRWFARHPRFQLHFTPASGPGESSRAMVCRDHAEAHSPGILHKRAQPGKGDSGLPHSQ